MRLHNFRILKISALLTTMSCASDINAPQDSLPGFESLKQEQKKDTKTTSDGYVIEEKTYDPIDTERELSISQILAECDRQIFSWAQEMSKSRTKENQQVVAITASAIGSFAIRYQQTLEDMAISGEPRPQGIASATLGFLGDESVLPILLNNVSSTEEIVISKALLGIGVLASPETSIAPIAAAIELHHTNEEVAANAAFCLFQLSFTNIQDLDGSMSTAILKLATHSNAHIRAQSVLSLGLIKANQCLPTITDALAGDPSPDVRVAAAWAMGKIGAKSSTLALINALNDPDVVTAGAARASLALIHGKDYGPDQKSWRNAIR